MFPARESLVCDIPAGDGKMANLCFTVQYIREVYIIKLFPARKSLVTDIPAGDGKIANLF